MKILLCRTKLHNGLLLHLQKVAMISLTPNFEVNTQYANAGDVKLPCENPQQKCFEARHSTVAGDKHLLHH